MYTLEVLSKELRAMDHVSVTAQSYAEFMLEQGAHLVQTLFMAPPGTLQNQLIELFKLNVAQIQLFQGVREKILQRMYEKGFQRDDFLEKESLADFNERMVFSEIPESKMAFLCYERYFELCCMGEVPYDRMIALEKEIIESLSSLNGFSSSFSEQAHSLVEFLNVDCALNGIEKTLVERRAKDLYLEYSLNKSNLKVCDLLRDVAHKILTLQDVTTDQKSQNRITPCYDTLRSGLRNYLEEEVGSESLNAENYLFAEQEERDAFLRYKNSKYFS